MGIDTLLREAIQDGFDNLKEMEAGTEKHKAQVDAVTKLVDRAIEIDKLESDSQYKVEAQEFEKEQKLKQAKDENIDRIIKNCLTAVSVVGTLGLTVWGARSSWRFEETGTITSTAGREFMRKLFNMK